MPNNFVHLHCHSQYSYLDGHGSAAQYISKMKEMGFQYAAITDHGVVDGCLQWQKEAIKQNMKFVLGCEAYITPNTKIKDPQQRYGHIIILVKNLKGWTELCRLLTEANLYGYYYKPRIGFDSLLNADLSGFVISTACTKSFINLPKGIDLLIQLHERMKGNVFLEIMPHDMDDQHVHNKNLLELHEKLNIPMICTNDCFAKDTLILTDKGYRFIQDIQAGDFVLTHKNRFKQVSYANSRKLNKNEKIFKLKTTIGSFAADVTENHPYYVCNYERIHKQLYNFKWKKAIQLNEDDYLIVPKIKIPNCDELTKFDLLNFYQTKLRSKTFIENNTEYIKNWRTDKKIKVPRYLLVTDQLLSIIGMYIANGCKDKYIFEISIHKKKIHLLEKAKKYFEEFGLNPGLKIENECARLAVSSKVFSNFFGAICGIYSHNKKFPLYLGFNAKQLLVILESYIACDGHCSKNTLMIGATVSIKLAYELSLLLNYLGFLSLPYIQNNHLKNKNWRPLYCLALSGLQVYTFSKLVKLDKEYKKPKNLRKHYVENNEFYAIKLIDKKEIVYNEKVYNFEVEEDNSYTANNYIVHNCHYIEEDDWEVQEVLLAIQTKGKWRDKDRFKFSSKGFYLRSEREMRLAFRKHCFTSKQIDEAMANTIRIAEMCCDFKIPKQEISLPSPYENINDDKFLYSLCQDGFKRFYESSNDIPKEYSNRLETEFNLIKKKNFSRYFLIFYDIIQWCKNNDIPVGPGRGSVGGSLIAFLIGITKVDPIKFHLSFARFISEDRIDFPDIDVDFAKKDREKVREYIREKYGINHTCGISTDMRLQSKAAIQAVARVFDIPNKDVMGFSKAINDRDKENGLQNAIDGEGAWFAQKYPDIVRFAKKLEGTVRGSGQHAAGQIISDVDLTDGTKCVLTKRGKLIVTNWDMDGCEYRGLMKMDILGLSTLSVLDECIRLINLK